MIKRNGNEVKTVYKDGHLIKKIIHNQYTNKINGYKLFEQIAIDDVDSPFDFTDRTNPNLGGSNTIKFNYTNYEGSFDYPYAGEEREFDLFNITFTDDTNLRISNYVYHSGTTSTRFYIYIDDIKYDAINEENVLVNYGDYGARYIWIADYEQVTLTLDNQLHIIGNNYTYNINLFPSKKTIKKITFLDCTMLPYDKYPRGITVKSLEFLKDDETIYKYIPYEKDGVQGFYNLLNGRVINNGNELGYIGNEYYLIGQRLIYNWDWYHKTSLLPEGYTQYDYLERGNNNAYINTGLYANTNTEMELDFMPLDVNGGSYFQLAGTYKVGGHFYMRMPYTSNSALFNLSQGVATTYFNTQNPTFRELNKRYVYKLNKDACYINGGKCKDFSNVDEFSNDDTATIVLFQVMGTSAFSQSMRVYGFKLKENGVLTANYIPCQRDSDGICGMYDLVSNTFKPSSNSYQFTCGNDSVLEGYTKYDYLAKTDSRQYIDTGLGYSDKTEVELGFKMIDQDFLGNYINLFGRITSEPKSVLYLRFMKASAYNGAIGDDSISTNGASAGTLFRDPSQKYIYTINKDGFYVNGNRIKALTNVAEFTDNNTLTLFRVEGGTINSALFQIYSLRIRENGELVADYVPVKRDSDGKCGMYDLLSGTFKTDNSGYGEMECGNGGLDAAPLALDYEDDYDDKPREGLNYERENEE